MYRFIRTSVLSHPSNAPAAIQAAQEIAGYVQKTHGVQLRVGIEVFGLPHLHWHADVDEANKLTEINAKLLQDKNFTTMLARFKDLTVDGSVHDRLVTLL